jgi:hypothetical protein
VHYTGRAICATEFCKTPCRLIIYQRSYDFQLFGGRVTSPSVARTAYTLASVLLTVSHRKSHSSCSPIQFLAAFRRVLDSNEPTSIVAIPESNAFLVHCESKLFSYRFDHIIGVSQGDAEPNQNGDWETRLAQDSGDVLFFKVGRIADQTLSERLFTC